MLEPNDREKYVAHLSTWRINVTHNQISMKGEGVGTAEDKGYVGTLNDLNGLLRGTFELSVRLNALEGNAWKRIASVLFAKINLCALSITKLFPPDSEVRAPESTKIMERDRFCDISSVASLCRNLIEASNRLYYLAVEKVTVHEAGMRLKIHEYHAVHGHRAILKFLNPGNHRLKELDQDLLQLKEELQQSRTFGTLSAGVRRRILEGRRGEALSQTEIAKRRGFEEGQFKADYKYLSSHIHSDAYSVLDLTWGQKAGGPMTPEIRERLTAMAREAAKYLALTLLDMTVLFPQLRLTRDGLAKARALAQQGGN